MAKVSLNTIKNWFLTGLKPTQQQFWNTWDSFFHKDDEIPQASIENLQESFDAKLDVEAAPYVNIDGYLVHRAGKTDLNNWEVNDKFDGWNGDRRVSGIVIALPFDIDDNTKVKLAMNSKAV